MRPARSDSPLLVILVDETERCLNAQAVIQAAGFKVVIAETLEEFDATVREDAGHRVVAFINHHSPSQSGQAIFAYANMLEDRLIAYVWTDWNDAIEARIVREAFAFGAVGAIPKTARPETLLEYVRWPRLWNFKERSSKDFLTGLDNRREFYRAMTALVDSASRYPYPEQISAVAIDINDFKSINDTHGHAVGDTALTAVGDCMREKFGRASDHLCRPGGDEFWIGMIENELQATIQTTQLRDLIGSRPIKSRNGEDIQISISAGIAQITAEEIKSIGKARSLQSIVDGLLDAADLKLKSDKDKFHHRDGT